MAIMGRAAVERIIDVYTEFPQLRSDMLPERAEEMHGRLFPALARAARRHGIETPPWLDWYAGRRGPRMSLRKSAPVAPLRHRSVLFVSRRAS